MKYYVLLVSIALFGSSTCAMELNIGARELNVGNRLVEAARDGDYKQVEGYLNDSVDPNVKHADRSIGFSAVVAAANEGHDAVVELLIKRGAEINITYEEGEVFESGLDMGKTRLPAFGSSALNFASERGHVSTVKLLLAHGADAAWFNTLGHTPLNNAVANGHSGVVAALLEAGSPVNYMPKYFVDSIAIPESGLPWVASGSFNLASSRGTEYSPLYTAVYKGYRDVVRVLLRYKADVVNTGSHTELLAVAYATGDKEIIAMLKDAGASLTYIPPQFLVEACKKANLNGIRLLAQSGVDLEERGAERQATPLMWCANSGLYGPCRLLISLGARLDATSQQPRLESQGLSIRRPDH